MMLPQITLCLKSSQKNPFSVTRNTHGSNTCSHNITAAEFLCLLGVETGIHSPLMLQS